MEGNREVTQSSAANDIPDDRTDALSTNANRRGSSISSPAVLQLLLALLVIRLYQVEPRHHLFTILALALAATAVLSRLPERTRPLFLSGVTVLAMGLILGVSAVWAIGVAVLLIVISYLPLALRMRVGLLVAVAAVLFWLRAESVSAFWAVVGSMFMFRLIVFLYETRKLPQLPPLRETLPYFFMLPNVGFVLFPVVDFNTWQRSRDLELSASRFQSAASWVVLGTVHLLIYRAIRYWYLIPPETIGSPGELLQFLSANYGLYLRVAGQFHISIGILHLFGYRLPKTHDWFFLASSFTDIWRRINIYWKDFMSQLFFMPTYFRLRNRLGDRFAICVAVGVTFVATWLAHSWQTFWLLGRFPLTWHDATLWLAAGAAVGVSSLLDYRNVKRKRSGSRTFSVRGAAVHCCKVMIVFVCVSLFWAEWTNPGIIYVLITASGPELLAGTSLVRVMSLLVAVMGTGVIARFVMWRLRTSGFADSRAAEQIQSAVSLVSMGVLLVAALPSMEVWLPNDPARVIATMKSDGYTESESSRMVQGYYEELNEGSLQTAVFDQEDPESRAQRSRQRQNFLDFTRTRNDALELELIPSVQGEYAGQTITTNRWGMRNPDISRSKPEGVWRIAVLGSSVVMGYGVGDEDAFCRLLEDRLNESDFGLGPERRAEVLNFGVGKYTVIHQMLQLEEKVFDFQPDVILYLCHQAEIAAPGLDLARLHAVGLIDEPGLLEIVRDAGVTEDTSPGPMRTMLMTSGPQVVSYCYRRIVDSCRERNVVPVWGFLNMPGRFPVTLQQEEIAPSAREAGFCSLDLTDWDAGSTAAEIMLTDGDPHANATGHQLIMRAVSDALRTCEELPFSGK